MVQICVGDIVTSDAAVICHQVNCRGAMGAGVAKAICKKWPEVKRNYIKLCGEMVNPADYLGAIQIVKIRPGFAVVNIFGQLNYGNDGRVYTDYYALRKAFGCINNIFRGETIAMPWKIGCGLGGCDWATVESLIVKSLGNCNVKLYMLPSEERRVKRT